MNEFDMATPASPLHTHQPAPSAHVLVLLPTYNGAKFLAEQLHSILTQTGVSVSLMCRDDGSTDASADILHDFETRFPQQVTVLRDELGNLGASGSFSHLMHAALRATQGQAQPSYVALSDQDDIWHNDKLATCVSEIRQLEAAHPGRPALVHSDLRVISEEGVELAPSMARYQGLQTHRSSLAAQVLSNTLTGCTSLMNRALLETGLPVSPDAIMHDWWLSMVASALGCRRYLDQSLIDYRQHASNAIGAKARDEPVVFRSIIHRLFDDRHGEIFRLNAQQAGAFLVAYRSRLSLVQRTTLRMAKALAWPFPPLQRLIYRLLRKL
ncbi:MAG: glycosyltransferase family 2 protein [Burkholderiaceae bacterium]